MLRAKINKDGCLELMRGGKFKEQLCPNYYGVKSCGDWCPLFGDGFELTRIEGFDEYKFKLSCCKTNIILNKGEFEDLRIQIPSKQYHQERHQMLHEHLDELFADAVTHGGLKVKNTILDLIGWSSKQAKELDHGDKTKLPSDKKKE